LRLVRNLKGLTQPVPVFRGRHAAHFANPRKRIPARLAAIFTRAQPNSSALTQPRSVAHNRCARRESAPIAITRATGAAEGATHKLSGKRTVRAGPLIRCIDVLH
jgi:hypothetical protein